MPANQRLGQVMAQIRRRTLRHVTTVIACSNSFSLSFPRSLCSSAVGPILPSNFSRFANKCKRKQPRPRLNGFDRLFWIVLRRFWPRWKNVLVFVKPEAVIAWHRAGFRLFWRWRSRTRGRRAKITDEIRVIIRRLAKENRDWGAPRIHGELQKLGFVVSERSVGRYLRILCRRGDPGQKWLSFLQNHREVIAAMDFFTVPTVSFGVLYCFFVIEHGRHRILHCNATSHPTSEWVVQQLREAFPETGPYRYVIFDRDSIFNAAVVRFLEATRLQVKRTSIRAPWQNGIGRTVGGNLSPRDARPHHRDQRTASPPIAARVRRLLPSRSNARFIGKGHPGQAIGRAETRTGRNGGCASASGWAAASIQLATSSLRGGNQ